jgi:hypothetical protein
MRCAKGTTSLGEPHRSVIARGRARGAGLADDGNQEAARMIEQVGDRALAVRCDVTRSQDVKAALGSAVDEDSGRDVPTPPLGVSGDKY